MSKYNVIEKIMSSGKLNENDKVFFIEMYLKDWSTVDDLKWIWEE